ncbi:MAG: hypothetical protein AAF602_17930 [Myxococcota bacterium]
MAGDRDDAPERSGAARGAGKLMERARQLGGTPAGASSRVVMPSDVLRGDDGPTVPVRDPNTAPIPRPRRATGPDAPPNVPPPAEDPDVTAVGLPANPVTGRPAGGGLDVVPVGAPTVRVPDIVDADEATQIRIEPDQTVTLDGPSVADEATDVKGAPPVEPDALAGTPRLATAEDLGITGADLQQEPLLKWIAIGLGLMVFVSVVFALVALLAIALAG